VRSRSACPNSLAREHIRQRDTLADYPDEILRSPLPVYHVTNPPYLYLGYIPKHPETRPYLRYFTGRNEGYQDLYQIALINDLRYAVPKMAYIIPSNFLFGDAISNPYLGLSAGERERLRGALRAGDSDAILQVIADNSRGDCTLRAPNTHFALGERDFDAVLLEGLVDGEVQVADEFAALVD
jgi:hypothetical protein